MIKCIQVYVNKMPRRKEMSDNLRAGILAASKAASKQLEVYTKKTFRTSSRRSELSTNSPQVNFLHSAEKKCLKWIHQLLWEHISDRKDCLEGLAGENLAWLTKLSFAKLDLNKPQYFWSNVLRADDTSVGMFGRSVSAHVMRNCQAWRGGGVMIWVCCNTHETSARLERCGRTLW